MAYMSWDWMVAVGLVLYALHRVIKAIGRVEDAVADLKEPSDDSSLRWRGEDQATPRPPASAVDDNGAGVRDLLRRMGK